jgi:rod shape determining protein RodA
VLGGLVVVIVLGVLWAAPAAGINILKSYQQQRLTCFIHPATCTAANGYNLNQSKTAVGSGGLRGRGVNNSTQVKLGFLPESQSDFAFSAFAEQRGFVGAVILLGLYLLVL